MAQKLTKRAARLIRPEERSEALHLAGVDIPIGFSLPIR